MSHYFNCIRCKEKKSPEEFVDDKSFNKICKECHRKSMHLRRNKCFNEWLPYLPKNPKCEICGKKLGYLKGSSESVSFDHKNDGLSIKTNPSAFLRQYHPTNENIAIWEKCDFGVLCNKCNGCLPTKGRKEWFAKAYKYIFFNKRNK